MTGASGEADDSEARVDTLTLRGTIRGSRVDGVLKRLHEEGGGVDRLDIVANAANDEGRSSHRSSLDWTPREDLAGSGTVSVQLNGDADSGYETNFRANVSGTTLTARGKVEKPFEALRFTGRADIAASGVMHVMGSFGAPEPLAAWIGNQASGPGFVFSSDVVWDKESLALNDFESVAGSFRLSGNAGWRAGEGEQLPKVTGTLEANVIDLTFSSLPPRTAKTACGPSTRWTGRCSAACDGRRCRSRGRVPFGSVRCPLAMYPRISRFRMVF